MTNNLGSEAPVLSSEAGASPCSRCQVNPRDRKAGSYCRDCRNVMAAEYRLKARHRPTYEERVCALDGCGEVFTWSSRNAKQECCSKSHYMKKRWRDQHPIPERLLPEDMRECTGCGEVKHRLEFSPSVWGRGGTRCRSCMAIYEARWSKENRERKSAASRRYRSRLLLREYGAPSDDLDVLIAAQGGLCACCGQPPTVGKGFHIDHDHSTGRYRGLLCHRCNARFYEGADLNWFLQAITYLGLDQIPKTVDREPVRPTTSPPEIQCPYPA